MGVCVRACVCIRACVRACVCMCVRACVRACEHSDLALDPLDLFEMKLCVKSPCDTREVL